jgi:hypothetical protein
MRIIATVAVEPVSINDAIEFIDGSLNFLIEEIYDAEGIISEMDIDLESIDTSENTPLARVGSLLSIASSIVEIRHMFEDAILSSGYDLPRPDDFKKLSKEEDI